LPTRDRARLDTLQLDALTQQPYRGPWELIVVDNGCRDDTLGLLDTYALRLPLRVVIAAERAGAAYARNRGAARALGDYLLFIDDEDQVAPEWLYAMAEAARFADVIRGIQNCARRGDGAAGGVRAEHPKRPACYFASAAMMASTRRHR
jgi:glycosyltransferase involved in cell wall biosynthesis